MRDISPDGPALYSARLLLLEAGSGMRGFKVSVCKEYLGFSSAHFITLSGHQCESLHGHNYRIGVTVEGDVDPECAFVVDFGVIKRMVRPHVQAMDHKVLLPTRNPKLTLVQDGDRTVVEYQGAARFVFPASNVALLPISNTTAEMIAEYLAHQFKGDLRKEGLTRLEAIEVEVEESFGQSGFYKLAMGE
jgi:6-pyruvoyltetrahydropterin/6-carboxytetrahydropterin synthase